MENRFKLPLIALTAGLFSLQVDAQTNTFPSTGNVGVGTTSPSNGLSILYSENQTTLGANTISSIRLSNSYKTSFGRRSELQFALGQNSYDLLGVIASEYTQTGGTNLYGGSLIFGTSVNSVLTERMRIDHNGKVGIGTSLPTANFHAVLDGNGANFQRYAGTPAIYLRKANGTEAATTIVNANEWLGIVAGVGYDGANYRGGASINFATDNTTGIDDMPGRISFHTTLDGSITSYERMRITNYGYVGINTTAPKAFFHVNVDGNGANFNRYGSNAAPSIYLQKANGTDAAPTVVANNDILGYYSAAGYTGGGTTGFQSAGSIQFAIDGVPGVNDVPGRIVFNTVPDNGTAFVERMRINNLGNVGIGTTAPGDLDNTIKFTVESTTATSRMALIGVSDLAAGSPSNTIWFMDRTNGSPSIKRVASIQTSYKTGVTNSGSYLQLLTFQKLTGTANFAINIDDKGYVGIGSQSPQGTLHVIQDGNLTRIDRYAGGAGIMLRRANGNSTTPTAVVSSDVLGTLSGYGYDGTSTFNAAAQVVISADGAGTTTAMPGRITFLTTPGGSLVPQEIVRINSAGKMGVGTTAPSSRLHVMGVAAGEYAMTVEHSNSLGNGLLIKAGGAGSNMNPLTIVDNTGGEILKVRGADKTLYVRELEVRIGAFPDYVFEKNYPLMPLSELEAYINTNKHLPNVPSAQEVEENGANVGNLVKVQMEKIEELTLYLIELKKENEEIKKQLEEIKNK